MVVPDVGILRIVQGPVVAVGDRLLHIRNKTPLSTLPSACLRPNQPSGPHNDYQIIGILAKGPHAAGRRFGATFLLGQSGFVHSRTLTRPVRGSIKISSSFPHCAQCGLPSVDMSRKQFGWHPFFTAICRTTPVPTWVIVIRSSQLGALTCFYLDRVLVLNFVLQSNAHLFLWAVHVDNSELLPRCRQSAPKLLLHEARPRACNS